MKKVKKQGGQFIMITEDKFLDCCYDNSRGRHICSSNCVACQINKSAKSITVSCLRGSFDFAEIVE